MPRTPGRSLIYANDLRDDGITVNAVSPGHCATDLNGHSGELTAEQGGEHVARQLLAAAGDVTGVFLSELGGTYPW